MCMPTSAGTTAPLFQPQPFLLSGIMFVCFLCPQTKVLKQTSNSFTIPMSRLNTTATYCAKVRSKIYNTSDWKVRTDWSKWSPEACWETGAGEGKESQICWSDLIISYRLC